MEAHAAEGLADLRDEEWMEMQGMPMHVVNESKLDEKKRNGSVAKKWETLAAVAAPRAEKDTDGRTRVYSGEVVWCSTCGAYADKKAHGMQTIFKGAPVREEVDGKYKYGGMWGQLRKLMRRIHPRTGEAMQEHCN